MGAKRRHPSPPELRAAASDGERDREGRWGRDDGRTRREAEDRDGRWGREGEQRWDGDALPGRWGGEGARDREEDGRRYASADRGGGEDVGAYAGGRGAGVKQPRLGADAGHDGDRGGSPGPGGAYGGNAYQGGSPGPGASEGRGGGDRKSVV